MKLQFFPLFGCALILLRFRRTAGAPIGNLYGEEYEDEDDYYHYYAEDEEDNFELEYKIRTNITEGDILKRVNFAPINGLRDRRTRWPNRTVLYSLDPEFTLQEIRLMEDAWDEIRSKTCVRIRPISSSTRHKHYVMVRKSDDDDGCSSDVGYLGWLEDIPQEINYAPVCIKKRGSILHEMLHTIGLYHEHARADRDLYISINWSNIAKREWDNFQRRTSSEVRDYGTRYDYKSVMHYNARAFCLDCRLRTIIPKKRGVQIGQRVRLSKTDVDKVNTMYGCERRKIVRKIRIRHQ